MAINWYPIFQKDLINFLFFLLYVAFLLLLKTCKSSKIDWTQLSKRYPHFHIKISNKAEVALKRLGKLDLNTMCPNYTYINHRGRNAAHDHNIVSQYHHM
jgi:hypothetical protein